MKGCFYTFAGLPEESVDDGQKRMISWEKWPLKSVKMGLIHSVLRMLQCS